MRLFESRPAAVIAAISIPLLALLAGPAASASDHAPTEPSVEVLATFGSGLGSGSTIGPDGALYVTDGNAGAVMRIDRRSGEVTTYASGLPPQVIGVGGAIDVAFRGRTAYVLVAAVSGDLLLPDGPQTIGTAVTGLYRVNRDGSVSVVADIGAWSAAHPPVPSFFLTTGVQYALHPYRDGFAVTDGHHNRVLQVGLDGSISELATFGDVVPTGLDVADGKVYVALAGPIPHDPKDAKVVTISRSGVRTVGSGAGVEGPGLTVDVERGSRHQLYALLQGVWDLPVTSDNEGSPASHDSGALVRVTDDGSLAPVVDHLDQPTSMEIVDDDAYVVTLSGTVLHVRHLDGRH